MNANKRQGVKEDENVVEQLIQHKKGLLRYSLFLTKDKWDADDLAQETVLKAIQRYHPSDISLGLLNKIAYHHWIDTVRKRKNEIVGIDCEASDDKNAKTSDEFLDAINVLVQQLTPKQAVIFLLKEGFNYQAAEIANMLAMTEMAVKSALHRARKRLERKTNSPEIVNLYWEHEEREQLTELFYESIQEENPTILIDCISKIHAFKSSPKLAVTKHSSTPHALYCMAA